MGSDASVIASDAIAYSLGYFDKNFTPIGGSAANAFGMQYQHGGITGSNLYNGNINNSTIAIKGIGSDQPVGYTYRYDQLNRLREMRQQTLSASTTTWNSSAPGAAYKESISYDGNGNILTYLRHGNSSQIAMDSLTYGYNRDSQGRLTNNRLRHVKDNDAYTSNYSEDLDTQGNDNYTYDAIGNLVHDTQAGISTIDWSVYGKIRSITKTNANDNISYTYDAAGNRVSKTVGTSLSTWYARDAQGNVLAVYDNAGSVTNWREQHLYGSSRLGMWKPDVNLASANGSSVWNQTGKKFFELSNHLGNVLAVITDHRIQNGSTYLPEIASAQDYYMHPR